MPDEREAILISRVVDGDVSPEDWDQLTALAEADPGVWERLADTLRDHAAFVRAVNASVAVAETVPARAAARPRRRPVRSAQPVLALLSWAGWAAAAAIALAWTLGSPGVRGQRGADPQVAGMQTAELSARDHLRAYLDQGRREDRVIGEVPERLLIETRPAETGEGYELLYLRQILERAVVPDLYQLDAQDELGRPTLVRYEPPGGPPM